MRDADEGGAEQRVFSCEPGLEDLFCGGGDAAEGVGLACFLGGCWASFWGSGKGGEDLDLVGGGEGAGEEDEVGCDYGGDGGVEIHMLGSRGWGFVAKFIEGVLVCCAGIALGFFLGADDGPEVIGYSGS